MPTLQVDDPYADVALPKNYPKAWKDAAATAYAGVVEDTDNLSQVGADADAETPAAPARLIRRCHQGPRPSSQRTRLLSSCHTW